MIDICRRYKKRWKFCAVLLCVSAFFNEGLVYLLTPYFHWPQFPVQSTGSVKLLLVGDPQLLGEHYTWNGIFGYIARWDSDRYVSKTFSMAQSFIKPDITLFLGDNLDEGEIATDEEFFQYFRRFKTVFCSADFDKAIILPGDNDIGGENEPPSMEHERRFEKFFKNDNFISYRFLEFVKVNYLTQSNDYLLVPNVAENAFRILLSHIPLASMYSGFTKKVFQHLQPHLVLSAHEHISVHLVVDTSADMITHSETSFLAKGIYTSNLTQLSLQEIMVPTCSYRMGTTKMGYGVLIINSTGDFTYSVLWLPSRFFQLYVYCGVLLLVLLIVAPFS